MQTAKANPLWSLESTLAELVTEATVQHHVPGPLATEARAATVRAFGQVHGAFFSERERARVCAYFWSVVKRRALRSADAARFTAHMVRASIAEDLRQAGLGEEVVARELERCTV